MILWFISVLVLARTGLVFAADRVHGLDVTLSHFMSLTGVERRGSFLSSDWCRQSHQALSVLGEFRSKLFFSCTLHHQYCCCYCSSNCSYLSPCSLSFVTPLLLSNPPAEGGKSEAVSKWLTTLWWLENLSGTTKLGSSIPQSQQSLGKYSMISPRMSSLINKIGMCSDDVLYLNSLILLFSNIISFLDDVNLVM